jgi:uncharacterized membrane protein
MASDGNIHFPPGQRRDKPTFEPPPWERDQFEELAKQKAEAEQAQAEEDAALAASLAALAEPVAEEAPAPAEVAETREAQTDQVEGVEKPELDPKHVEVLMMGLRSEEPRPEEAYWKISMFAGVTSALIGLVVTTWGVVALATPKQPGIGPFMLVTMLLVFGVGFMAGGAWVVFNSLRQRGVL